MRILVMNEEDGISTIRERREVFNFTDFLLGYSCPTCGTEFTFRVEKQLTKWNRCPACGLELRVIDATYPNAVLWEALERFRDLQKFVSQHELPIKLLTVTSKSQPGEMPIESGKIEHW